MQRQKGSSHSVYGELIGRAILLSLVVLLAGVDGRAQHAADNWFFGSKAGLNFSSGVPVPSGDSDINTHEGSAVMSDRNGNLLFYTDGQTVWNRNHEPMQNGTGLLGASSSTQSALIVPWPKKDCKMYFIFTVQDVQEVKPHRPQTLNYSLVNMSLAGGLGGVTSQKNVLLKSAVSEKLTAVADDAGTGFWVIAHGFDMTQTSSAVNREFYAYHVGPDGLKTAPQVSPAGSAHTGITIAPYVLPHHASQGQMKVSPDGKLIACAVRSRFVEILSFSPVSGQVTDTLETFSTSLYPFQSQSVYGVEFSPDSKLLYVTTTGGGPNQLLQYALESGQWSQLHHSPGSGFFYDLGALQLGPDKKIYVARPGKPSISVIDSPQTVGGAKYMDGPSLPTGAESRLGLPTIIQGDFSCAGDDSREECCDKLSVAPVMTMSKFSLDTKTFTISNLKAPASAICSIDINLSPAPPFKQVAGLVVDGAAVPAGTRFVAPYNRLPNAGAPTISAANTVKFKLSIPNNPPSVYTVTFVVKHCDGTQCILTYSPWQTSTPGLLDTRHRDNRHQYGANNFALGGRLNALNSRRNSDTTPGFGGWLAYNLPGPFAVTGEVDFFPRKSSSSTLDGDVMLQAFAAVKVVKQFDDFAVYGKFGPGAQHSRQAIKGFTFRDEQLSGVIVGENNLFALQSGGGVELCTSSRLFTSIETGIVSTRRTNRFEFVNSRPVSVPAFWENNLQFSYTVGYRFRLGGRTP